MGINTPHCTPTVFSVGLIRLCASGTPKPSLCKYITYNSDFALLTNVLIPFYRTPVIKNVNFKIKRSLHTVRLSNSNDIHYEIKRREGT